jgi:hypothetical protein
MKLATVFLILGTLATGTVWAQEGSPPGAPSQNPHTSYYMLPKDGPAQEVTALTPAEIKELGDARNSALAANPFLAAEGQVLAEKIVEYRKKLNAAMIKADPKVAAILAKIPVPHPPGPGGPPPPPNGGN